MTTRPLHLVLLASCLATPLAAQTRPLSYDDYYRIERAGDARISPDGQRVAFVRSRVLEEENRTHTEVWMVPVDGSAPPARVTSPSTEASSPRWSPDGRLLAFSSSRDVAGSEERSSTWLLPMDRPGEAFQLPGLTGSPIFDPTGARIAFTRPVPPDQPAASGPELSEEERRIVDRFDGRAYDWMQFRFDRRGYLPDPTDPYATPSVQIFVMPAGGGVPTQLTDLPVNASAPAWRPDGTAVAFTADLHQRDEHTYPRADLFTVTLDGTVQQLTDDEYNWSRPVWSPDGGSIVVSGQVGLDVIIRERWDHGSPSDLFLFGAEGGEPRNLTESWDLIPGTPTWSADGRSLFFTAGIGGNTHLVELDVATGQVAQVTSGEARLGSVTFSADGTRVALVQQTAIHPGDVFAGPAPGRDLRRLTALNADLLAELELRQPERMQFASADGTEIEGWVIPPVGWDGTDAREWPMVLNMHGGPHGAYGNSFSFDFHLQSGNGYFVVYTNPRASTGYGEAFRWGTWGSWGDEDYDDVMAGVDAALGRFPIDEQRMGVTGYSYGGYLTNWVITQTDRFSAAVAGAGISNWMSDYAVADIPRTKETEFYGTPWQEEGLQNLLAASPIVHAEGVSTPTLFVHGESDYRVPIEEAEQMYVALRKQRVPARMVRYPDSYHGGWTPWRYLHRLYSTMEWWDEWLATKPVS